MNPGPPSEELHVILTPTTSITKPKIHPAQIALGTIQPNLRTDQAKIDKITTVETDSAELRIATILDIKHPPTLKKTEPGDLQKIAVQVGRPTPTNTDIVALQTTKERDDRRILMKIDYVVRRILKIINQAVNIDKPVDPQPTMITKKVVLMNPEVKRRPHRPMKGVTSWAIPMLKDRQRQVDDV